MIFVSTARPMGDDPVYDSNQLFAKASWEKVADAIAYFNNAQPALASPKTRFIPSQPYPFLRDIVDLCADQDDWTVIINADIWIHQAFTRIEQKLRAKKAVAASSFRWNFDPAVGVESCAHNDNGLDFFAATPGAWEMVYQKMGTTPQGDADSPRHLRLGAPQWDSWLLGTFFHLFSNVGFYDITDTRCVRHPIHGGRKYGTGVPMPHFYGWPCQGIPILQAG